MKSLQFEMLEDNKVIIEQCINSGQVFLWNKEGKVWYGINGNNIICVKEDFSENKFVDKSNDFFRNNDDIEKIFKSITKDKVVKKAVKTNPGLRILRQDPFQCYISFIVSSNSNIQNIRRSLENLCKKFGQKIKFQGKEFFLFPEPKMLAKATKNDLNNCGLGYRASFVKEASNLVTENVIDFEHLKKTSYQKAKNSLLDVYGIGNKVADCILLFSLEKLEAFPLDRWMIRILEKYFSDKFQLIGKTITQKKYDELHEKIVNHFGPYAGYSQQFLFKMERDLFQKKWL